MLIVILKCFFFYSFFLSLVDMDPVFVKKGTLVIHSLKASKAQFSQTAPLSVQEREQLAVSDLPNKINILIIKINNIMLVISFVTLPHTHNQRFLLD